MAEWLCASLQNSFMVVRIRFGALMDDTHEQLLQKAKKHYEKLLKYSALHKKKKARKHDKKLLIVNLEINKQKQQEYNS